MSFIQILVSVLNGLLDIILAIPRLLLWLFELFSATSKAEIARPALVSIEAELKNNGLLKDFTNELKGVADIIVEAPSILENSKNDNIMEIQKKANKDVNDAKDLNDKAIKLLSDAEDLTREVTGNVPEIKAKIQEAIEKFTKVYDKLKVKSIQSWASFFNKDYFSEHTKDITKFGVI